MAAEPQEKAWNKEKIKARIEGNELDLSLCSISKVPVNFIIPFNKLTSLDLSCNRINILPENFSKLVQLVQLDLSKNAITELPEDFGELVKLRKLDLFKNNLEELPLSFHRLKSLQWLDLKANPIQEIHPKLVGDCLKPAECQECAKKIVDHYSTLNYEKVFQERKAKKLESERLAKKKQEEDQVRQRRKDEKKRRHEEKRSENKDQVTEQTSNGILENKDEIATISGKPSSGTSCMKCFLYLFLFIIICGLIKILVFKGNVEEVKLHLDEMLVNGKKLLERFTKT